ncbi:MAG: hypothetical protein OXG64_06435 [Chloroflexi bacterium]|nr:hypothetical protein [Chloroflexota bacterium]
MSLTDRDSVETIKFLEAIAYLTTVQDPDVPFVPQFEVDCDDPEAQSQPPIPTS